MSGHSKWHSIKHKKEATDAKRGKAFTRYIKEITIAARLGGGDPETNPRLRHAIDGAKSVNMPGDNIKKAIQRGTGELDGIIYEAITYEGYGPGGAAIMVEVLTDNKNRSVAEVRHVFSKYSGNLGEKGCVGWMFARKGLIIIDRGSIEEDELLEIVLESGAEDLKIEGETYEVITTVEEFDQVLKTIKDRNLDIESSEITMIPSSFIKLDGKQAESMLRLFEKLEELDDVQNVWANFDISEEDIENYQNS
jgi:YebC/PmpR family DNA-binding regulatory protein